MLSLRARPKTFHNPQLMRGRQHPQQRGRKFPQHSARPYTGSYVAGRTTEQTQWFRFESCWSPPLGTASRPPNSSLPAHPTGVEPRLEPGRTFSHPLSPRCRVNRRKFDSCRAPTDQLGAPRQAKSSHSRCLTATLDHATSVQRNAGQREPSLLMRKSDSRVPCHDA